LSFYSGEKNQVTRFDSGDLARMQSILQFASANLGTKTKKLTILKIYLMKKQKKN